MNKMSHSLLNDYNDYLVSLYLLKVDGDNIVETFGPNIKRLLIKKLRHSSLIVELKTYFHII
jgi:hypothetical protein